MGASLSRKEDPSVLRNAGRRQTALVILAFVMFLLAGADIGLSFWQVSFGGVQGGSSPAVCDGFRPSIWTAGAITTTCVWGEANSAVRILAGFLTILAFVGVLLLNGRFRTERKIVYILAVGLMWIGTTCWLVLAGWDANEIRLSANNLNGAANVTYSMIPFGMTVLADLLLWLVGWVFCIVYSVWLKKEDYKRPAGLCVPGRKSGHAEFVGSAPAPSAPSFAEMEDF